MADTKGKAAPAPRDRRARRTSELKKLTRRRAGLSLPGVARAWGAKHRTAERALPRGVEQAVTVTPAQRRTRAGKRRSQHSWTHSLHRGASVDAQTMAHPRSVARMRGCKPTVQLYSRV